MNEKCLLTNPEFDRKPAFYAYQNLCAVWKPEYKPQLVDYNVEVIDPGIFYGIGEEDDAFPSVPLVTTFSDEEGNNLLAWWLPWNMQEYLPKLAKVNISIEGLTFTDPVILDPLSGEVYELNVKNNEMGCVFEDICLADYPFIVVERETIKLN